MSDIVAHMESSIDKWQINIQHQISFSLSIDSTKVAVGVEISSASNSIIGSAYPHQWISIIYKDIDLIKTIVDQDTDSPILFDKAS